MSAMHFHLSFEDTLYPSTCNVPFTHWLNYFSGKWESKTVVLVIARIFKEKNFVNSKCLVVFKVTQTVKESVLCHFSQPGVFISQTTDGISSPCIESVSSSTLDHQGSPNSRRFLGLQAFPDEKIWAAMWITRRFLSGKKDQRTRGAPESRELGYPRFIQSHAWECGFKK